MIVLLSLLAPAMAWAAGIEVDTGLLKPPMVNNKPVNVNAGLFHTNLIDAYREARVFER